MEGPMWSVGASVRRWQTDLDQEDEVDESKAGLVMRGY